MQISKYKIIIRFLFSIFILLGFLFVPSDRIYAASLSLSPGSTTVSVGNIISLKVLVNTNNKYINNSEATVQFPVDMLEVVSMTKSSSIFTLWVEEPSFSNYNGKIIFNGGVPTPGYNGNSGYIATITFKAKKQGVASVILTDAAVRENDGLGTDILTSKYGSNITIGISKVVEVPAVTTVAEKSLIPEKPIITSDTHPDQDVWYSKDTATFNWKIPSGVTKIQTLYSKDANANPTINYDNSVTQKTLNNLSDGISYFHLRYYNTAGKSLVAHFKVKIDTVSPLPFVPVIRNENDNNFIKLDATDSLSGIDYYTLQIDNNQVIKVKLNELSNKEYILPILLEGNHDVIVTAYDKAKNSISSNISFNSSSVIPPVLEVNTQEIIIGDTINITGKSVYPNKKVEVTLQFEDKELKKYTQTISKEGSFSLVTDEINKKGLLNIWGEVLLSDKVRSSPSQTLYLKVKDTKVVSTALSIIYPLLGALAVIILFTALLFATYIGWHKFFGLKKEIKRNLKYTAEETHKAMKLLREELNTQLEILEKVKIDRSLNKKEEIIFNKIKENVDDIDDFIEKKLNKII